MEIGRARLAIRQPEKHIGTHAYVMQEEWRAGPSPILKGAQANRWIAVGIPGHAGESKMPLNPAEVERISLPPRFAKALYEILVPGTTLLVTDAPVLEQQTTAVALNIMNSDRPTLD